MFRMLTKRHQAYGDKLPNKVSGDTVSPRSGRKPCPRSTGDSGGQMLLELCWQASKVNKTTMYFFNVIFLIPRSTGVNDSRVTTPTKLLLLDW